MLAPGQKHLARPQPTPPFFLIPKAWEPYPKWGENAVFPSHLSDAKAVTQRRKEEKKRKHNNHNKYYTHGQICEPRWEESVALHKHEVEQSRVSRLDLTLL